MKLVCKNFGKNVVRISASSSIFNIATHPKPITALDMFCELLAWGLTLETVWFVLQFGATFSYPISMIEFSHVHVPSPH
jgi:hypothetical protein